MMFRSIISGAFLFWAATMLACQNNTASTKPVATSAPAPSPGSDGNSDNPPKTSAFDGERAFNHVKAQVAFGPRPAGSAAVEKTREYLVKELKSYGLAPALDEFTETTPHGKIKFKNVIAELPGET